MKSLFLDWSGDAGLKINEGSSKFLVHACVTNTSGFAEPLNRLRRQYRLGDRFYFHFNNASQLIKQPFFNLLGQSDINGIVLRVHKTRLEKEWRLKRGDQFIAETIAKTISTLSQDVINGSVLIIDGNRDEIVLHNKIRRAISIGLKDVGEARLKKVSVRPAREEDGLQVADMLAGAAASERLSDNALLGSLGDKVKLIDFWGKK